MDNTWSYYKADATTAKKAQILLHKVIMEDIYKTNPELFDVKQRNQLVRFVWVKHGDRVPVESILRWARDIKKNTETINAQLAYKHIFA